MPGKHNVALPGGGFVALEDRDYLFHTELTGIEIAVESLLEAIEGLARKLDSIESAIISSDHG